MSPAIWRKDDDGWSTLPPSGFPSEEALHDLVEETPNLLPLSGDPTLQVVGREVSVGPGRIDLVAVDVTGEVAVIEIKLGKNSEARRAVVAQILTYAAYLKGLDVTELEQTVLRPHLIKREYSSLLDAARSADQSGDFDTETFSAGLAASLANGAFRLVLVLDEAPSELVQLVGYLESISREVKLDLITVSAYEAGGEQILVPQRVDPDYAPASLTPATIGANAGGGSRRKSLPEVDGSESFEESIERAAEADRAVLRRLLAWARELESRNLASLKTVLGTDREILLVWVPGQKAGLVSIWNDGGGYISLWRTVFVRLAWDHIAAIEGANGKAIGQGTTIRDPAPEVLDLLTAAYVDAAKGTPEWNGRDYYVAFGENDQRHWDEAIEFGFVSAGGGEWYSKTLRQLKPGNRVFVYIPKGSGVGGYVGVGEVTGEPALARDFVVERGGEEVRYLDVTSAPLAGQNADDPLLAEWLVPVTWTDARSREEAVKDSDSFANQNTAVKFTHGYTLAKLEREFGL